MDYYLTKPMRTQELLSLLDEIAKHTVFTDQTIDPRPKNPSGEAVDLATALERLDGDRALFEELTLLFEDECPKTIEGMRRAIALHDAKSLEHLAHTLKGPPQVWAPSQFRRPREKSRGWPNPTMWRTPAINSGSFRMKLKDCSASCKSCGRDDVHHKTI